MAGPGARRAERVTPRRVIAHSADRLLHTTALRAPGPIPDDAAFHRSIPVVDLLAGSALMRADFLRRRRHGHVDLPRLVDGGVNLVGLTIATRHPDLRGTFSLPFFWSQGFDMRTLRSDMAIAEALVSRVTGWESSSSGRLRIVRTKDDAAAIDPGAGWVGVFLGVQGGHILEGDPRNLARLHDLGVRMFAPAHVMDNALVGSDTGIRRGGLTGLGREVIAECERLGILVDLAHMSPSGVREAVGLLRRPFVLSHTGFAELAGRTSRWRSYTPGTRNIGSAEARLVAAAGGVVGVTLSTWLLGGSDMDAMGHAFDLALELCGPGRVAIGSDMDGGLRMVIDAAGMPSLTAELLGRGHDRETVAAVMGGNALRVLGGAWS